jgi:hypothetical protein
VDGVDHQARDGGRSTHRQRSGTITLTGADNRLIAAMLHSSDDDAADTLWSRYGGADQAFNNDSPPTG